MRLFAAVLMFAALTGPARADWPAGGLRLGPIAQSYGSPTYAVADGAGGAIVLWYGSPILAQHVTAEGNLAPGWPSGGLAITTTTGSSDPRLTDVISDGAGGVILAFGDILGAHVAGAQRVLPDGTKAWGPLGVTTGSHATGAWVEPDGSGGAFLAWSDDQQYEIRVTRITAAGLISPGWPSGGVLACAHSGNRFITQRSIAADGSGGVYVAWQDFRDGRADVYAQHVLAGAAVDPNWNASGTPIGVATNDQLQPVCAPDGAGGMFAMWSDLRPGIDRDLYSQHMLPNGLRAPGWPLGGLPVSVAPGSQDDNTNYGPFRLLPDGSGNVLAAWTDGRNGPQDIYALRMDGTGSPVPGWITNGSPVCTAVHNQVEVALTQESGGGAYLAWSDHRNDNDYDIYLQRMTPGGQPWPGWSQDGELVEAISGDQRRPAIAPDGSGNAIVAWQDGRDPLGVYATRFVASAGVSVPPANRAMLELTGAQPNPARDRITVRFALSDASPATLELLDLAGRRLQAEDVGFLGSGAHAIHLRTAPNPGLYFLRLTRLGESRVSRLCVVQ